MTENRAKGTTFAVVLLTEVALKREVTDQCMSLGKLPTYPFPNLTLTLAFGKRLGLARGTWVVSHKFLLLPTISFVIPRSSLNRGSLNPKVALYIVIMFLVLTCLKMPVSTSWKKVKAYFHAAICRPDK